VGFAVAVLKQQGERIGGWLGVKCVLRDYGIVVADRNAIPPGATLLLDAWRKPASK
jgi:hypothetical protein